MRNQYYHYFDLPKIWVGRGRTTKSLRLIVIWKMGLLKSYQVHGEDIRKSSCISIIEE